MFVDEPWLQDHGELLRRFSRLRREFSGLPHVRFDVLVRHAASGLGPQVAVLQFHRETAFRRRLARTNLYVGLKPL
jgi:hypothetical protein